MPSHNSFVNVCAVAWTQQDGVGECFIGGRRWEGWNMGMVWGFGRDGFKRREGDFGEGR